MVKGGLKVAKQIKFASIIQGIFQVTPKIGMDRPFYLIKWLRLEKMTSSVTIRYVLVTFYLETSYNRKERIWNAYIFYLV